MTAVFRDVRRVLRDDGTLFLNLGDSYNAYNGGAGPSSSLSRGSQTTERPQLPTGYGLKAGGKKRRVAALQLDYVQSLEAKLRWGDGLKPKDLVGIPWRLAFALQADGWYLRSDTIWHKPNPMPESVTDRPTKSHEYLFLLTKSEQYYFDGDAVREDGITGPRRWLLNGCDNRRVPGQRPQSAGMSQRKHDSLGCRNIRSVWTIPTEAYAGAHFATFPRKLVEPCIKAGTSEKGCCSECGKPWERVTEREEIKLRPKSASNRGDNPSLNRFIGDCPSRGSMAVAVETTGWRPTCPHAAAAPVPCVVLDPFAGSGTSGVVALALGRQFIGLDLSREYLGMATRRISRPHAPVVRTGRAESYPLFGDEDDEPDDQPSFFGVSEAEDEADEALQALPGM